MLTEVKAECGSTTLIIDYSQLEGWPQLKLEQELNQFCHKKVSSYVYNQRTGRFSKDREFSKHDKDNKKFILPREFMNKLKQHLFEAGFSLVEGVDNSRTYRPRDLRYHIKFDTRPEQVEPIKHISDPSSSQCGLELQTGCLTGDTVVNINRGGNSRKYTLEQAYYAFNNIKPDPGMRRHGWDKTIPSRTRSLVGDTIQLNDINDIVYSGKKKVFTLTLANGQSITGTPEHKIMTKDGYVELSCCVGEYVMCDTILPVRVKSKYNRYRDKEIYGISKHHPYARRCTEVFKKVRYRITEHIAIYEASINNMELSTYLDALNDPDKVADMVFVNTKTHCIHHKDGNHYNNSIDNLVCMTHLDHRKLHSEECKYNFNQGVPTFIEAVKLEEVGVKDVYDIECVDPHHNFVANGIVVHNSGKTYCAIRAIGNLGQCAMIMTGNGKLLPQWHESFLKTTDIDEGDIYTIKGFTSIKKLLKMEHKPKVFICSTSTMRVWAKGEGNYADIPSLQEFIEDYGIGIKVVDEAHLMFHATCMVDLATNVRHSIYLTATFKLDNSSTKKLFETYFPNQIKYRGSYKQYTTALFYSYAYSVQDKWCHGNYGYSHDKYEHYVLQERNIFNMLVHTMLVPLINQYYVNKSNMRGKRVLILCGTVDFIKELIVTLGEIYPEYKFSTYVEGDSEEVLETSDFIISTRISAGTGNDIPDLRLVINTISIAASNSIEQMFGRLRDPKGDGETIFIDVHNRRINSHARHKVAKYNVIRPLAKKTFDYHM